MGLYNRRIVRIIYDILFLGDIAESDFACWYRCYCSVVCLSVCHVRALCSNGRRYRHVVFCKR